MNSIILIAACAVCLDQLFFRGRLASYVVDNLKGPKKKHTGHNAAPHTPNAGTAPRQTPEILVSKSYRCGLERTGADIGTEAFYPVVYCGRIDYSGNCANRKISIGSAMIPESLTEYLRKGTKGRQTE